MVDLLAHPKVHAVTSDQCMYGLVTPSSRDGRPVAAMKPTRWATSSPQMAARLTTRCSRDHPHEPLLGGRAADAAFYPMKLVTEILRGMRDTADAEAAPEDAEQEAEHAVEDQDAIDGPETPVMEIVPAKKEMNLVSFNDHVDVLEVVPYSGRRLASIPVRVHEERMEHAL